MKCYSFCHLEDLVLDRDFDASITHLWSATAITLAYLAEFDHRKRYLPAPAWPGSFRSFFRPWQSAGLP